MPANKKEWEITLNRTHLFLIILLAVAASGASFTLGNMLGKGEADKMNSVESTPAYNVGRHLRDKDAPPQKEAGGEEVKITGEETAATGGTDEARIKENDLTFYKTLSEDKPGEITQGGAAKKDIVEKGKETAKPEPLKAESPHQKEFTPPADKNGEEAYAVQLGAFKNQSEANVFIRNMETKGYKPYMVPFSKDGATWYRVRVGTAKRVEDARRLANEIYQRENIKTIIVRLK